MQLTEDQQRKIVGLEARLAVLEARASAQDRAARRARWIRIAFYVAIGLFYVFYLRGLSGLS